MPTTAPDRESGRVQMGHLVEGFQKNLARCTAPSFLEGPVRQEYINPFWQALGWPIGEQPSVAPVLRDVCIETNIRGTHPDYQFQPNGVVAFFCEAKKPAEDLQHNRHHIFQAKSYAWSFQRGGQTAPFCVLTDFEEFRFFTVGERPSLDRPRQGLIPEFDIRYTDYLDRFDDLWDTFGRTAVAGGSLERFLSAQRDHRHDLNIDFLEDLLRWRQTLAEGTWQANPDCSEAEVNELVQRALDRVLFIRMMEERGLEPTPLLRAAATAQDPWAALVELRRTLRPRYNGQLFAPHFSDDLHIPPPAIRTLLDGLDPRSSPYRFNAMDVALLGRIYEAYLGRTIKRRDGRCVVELRWDRRKDGGVYYTPKAVVDLICDRVLGPLLQGKTPATLEPLRVLDPACGSGAFLIGAYDYLLKWHRRWYNRHKNRVLGTRSKFRDDVELDANGDLRLSLQKRAAILERCIYGVDIDPGAVQVAVLSLYIKLLEEYHGTGRQLVFVVRGALLPSLERNLVCGNALVGPEVFEHLRPEEANHRTLQRIQPLDWKATFPHPFDAVVGNPPYIKEPQNRTVFEDLRRSRHAGLYRGKMDLWYAFTGASLDVLREGGRHGFITQNNWPRAQSASKLRAMLRARATLESLVDFHDRMIFDDAGIQTMVYVLRKAKAAESYAVQLARLESDRGTPLEALLLQLDEFTHREVWLDPGLGEAVMPLVETAKAKVLEHMERVQRFQLSRDEVGQGIIGGPDKAFLHPSLDGMNPEERALLYPHHTTAHRFGPAETNRYIAYLTDETAPALDAKRLPHIAAQLTAYAGPLRGRRETKQGKRAWHPDHQTTIAGPTVVLGSCAPESYLRPAPIGRRFDPGKFPRQ